MQIRKSAQVKIVFTISTSFVIFGYIPHYGGGLLVPSVAMLTTMWKCAQLKTCIWVWFTHIIEQQLF